MGKDKKILCILHSEEELHNCDEEVISLREVKDLLKAFKVLKIKDDNTSLIFGKISYNNFREVGEQHKQYWFVKESHLKEMEEEARLLGKEINLKRVV